MKLMFALLLYGFQAHAAVSKNILLEGALRQPLSKRLQVIEKEGLHGQHELQKIAFNKAESLDTRWRAVTSYGRVYKNKSQKFLEHALRSPEWFMRNAALMVVSYADRTWAIKWSRLMLHDKALVVRTAAVQALRHMNATETQALLWEKLYSSENYRGGKSLWVRRHILEALEQFARPGQEASFISVLNDKDMSLHPIAVRTLSKLTSEKYTSAAGWQQWWKKQKNI